MKSRIILVTPIYVLLVLFFASASYSRNTVNLANALVAETKAESAAFRSDISSIVQVVTGTPTSLYIPRLDLTTTILDGTYNVSDRTWTLSKSNAHFALETNSLSTSESGGLSLIYGHNTKYVFEATKKLQKGDILEVSTKEGQVFSYRFYSDEIVLPTDTSLFEYKGKPRLVIMSCTGEWNEKRRIMNFELISTRDV